MDVSRWRPRANGNFSLKMVRCCGRHAGLVDDRNLAEWTGRPKDTLKIFKGQVIATTAHQICIDGLHIHTRYTSVQRSPIFFQLSRRVWHRLQQCKSFSASCQQLDVAKRLQLVYGTLIEANHLLGQIINYPIIHIIFIIHLNVDLYNPGPGPVIFPGNIRTVHGKIWDHHLWI